MPGEDAALDLDHVAALLRADTSDLSAFVEGLASKLEAIVPGRVRVERRRTGLLGPKYVSRILVDASDRRLELLCVPRGTVQTRAARLSGGIVLKSDALDPDAWMAALSEAIAAEAARSANTREALERLLIR